MEVPEPNNASRNPRVGTIRQRLWRIIFLSDTPAGRLFDVVLLWLIGLSVLLVMMESVESLAQQHGVLMRGLEWFFTVTFTVEFVLRCWVARRPLRYVFSFFGIVDLVSILPSYLELFLTGTHYLMVIRILRLLRMFRILKMAEYLGEASVLLDALRASKHKISVFLFAIAAAVCVEGTVMYVIENPFNAGFSSIPQSVYWAVVTITTVGYGDIAPATVLGKMMACVIMLTGFSIIAVPTGVFTAELGRSIAEGGAKASAKRCAECGTTGHPAGARYCHRCGTELA